MVIDFCRAIAWLLTSVSTNHTLVPRPTSPTGVKEVIPYSVAIKMPQLLGRVLGDSTQRKTTTMANSANLTGVIRAHYTWTFTTFGFRACSGCLGITATPCVGRMHQEFRQFKFASECATMLSGIKIAIAL